MCFTKLNTLYNYALANGYILESEHAVRPLVKKLGSFPKGNYRHVYLTDTDLPKWHDAVYRLFETCIAAPKLKRYTLVGPYALLVLYTAMRATETRCLAWKPSPGDLPDGCSGYVDLDNRCYCLLGEASKNGKTELFPLARQPMAILRRLWMRTGKTPWLFPGQGDKPLCGSLVRMTMKRIAHESGISDPRVGSHDVRRTTTTIGAHVVPGHALDRLTRHAARTITGKRYVVHDLEKLRRPAQILADEVDRIAQRKTPVEIVIPRDRLPILLGALKGHREARALLHECAPNLAEIMEEVATESVA